MTIKNNQVEDAGKAITASNTPPTTGSGKGAWYTKVVSGIAEGFYVDSAGTIIQMTSNGAPVGGGGGAVSSVNGLTGTVVLTKSSISLGNVDNTSDANKPISTATQTALNLKQDDLSVPSQAEAEAGTSTAERVWTAQRVAQAIAALAGSGTSEVTKWLSFESGDVKILATGLLTNLNAVTAVKSTNTVTIGLPGSAPYSVKIHSVKARFTAADMAGVTTVSLVYPEPTGETSLALSVRALGTRFNSAYVAGGQASTVVSNSAGTMTTNISGLSTGLEQYAQWLM